MNFVNVKKILLFEVRDKYLIKLEISIRTSFRIFREKNLFLAEVSKS